ncbi:MAG: 23S rRNA (guanosine(2251)-2'-O)-methyltransferase RlmB [Actinobacteria bacterium]|nr:23S rRNA (guanosine(2251)-2'-O)-methyltransferase RlmB [Actinomycetota bacterium]
MDLINLKSNLELICGINPVYSLLKTNAGKRKIYEIYLSGSKGSNPQVKKIFHLAKEKRIKFNILEDKNFERLIINPELKAQGICAKVTNYTYHDLDIFLTSQENKNCRLLILDNITDAGNFGAIIRSAFAFEFDGIIIPKHRSIEVNKDTSRISAGTLEEMKIFQVSNLVQTIKKLKENKFWIYGTDVENKENVKQVSELDFIFPMALILGSEHKGISRLSRENSDILLRIDINKELDSINVSVAAGIILYEIYMQIKENEKH